MTLIRPRERAVVRAIAALVDCNPFLPERIDLERRALGSAFLPATAVWHAEGDATASNPNADRLRALVERVAEDLHTRLAAGVRASAEELATYRRVVFYWLFQRYEDDWYGLIESAGPGAVPAKRVACYSRFARDLAHLLSRVPGPPADPAHLFALGFQARRAFHHIFRHIFGGSLPAARLRAAVWQSIFTHDGRCYREQLYIRMADIPTLILGESGTGKELVARAIARSQYVPFDARAHTFAAGTGFFAVNLSALSPMLIESELFGHRRGAFTGAIENRRGWLETCGPHGAVFLDEIGELDGGIQVKLLRVLQSREFQPIGEIAPRRFGGKLIAATHRDLNQAMQAGRFRADLYYRICADVVRTPTLREQLAAAPGDFGNLVGIVAGRVAGPEAATALAHQVETWVAARLGSDYAWPGNMRELEQCVRNILIRGEYTPSVPPLEAVRAASAPSTDAGAGAASTAPPDPFLSAVQGGSLTAEELLQAYCAQVHLGAGSYEEAARRLDLDPRTVRAKVRAWSRRPRADQTG